MLQESVVQIHSYYFLSPFFWFNTGTLEYFPGVQTSKICEVKNNACLYCSYLSALWQANLAVLCFVVLLNTNGDYN